MLQTATQKIRTRQRTNLKRWNGQLCRTNGGDCYGIYGKHKERGLVISFHGLNCAPEQFHASINGRHVNLTYPSDLGMMLMCKPGPQGIIDELKRMYRKELRRREEAIAYGYSQKANRREYTFIHNYGYCGNLRSRLSAYKDAKNYFRENGWKLKVCDTAKLGPGFQVESVKETFVKFDPTSPVMVHIRFASGLFYPEKDTKK